MRDVDTKTLRLFVAVCEHRNMARAADEQHIEPSAVSKRIAQFERDLGAALLTRSRRGVEPTAAGVIVLEHARSVLFTMDRLAQDVTAFGRGLSASVTLCASASAIAEALLDDVSSFMREPANENIRVNVEEWISRDLVRRIRDARTPIGICWDNAELDGLQKRPYRDDRLALAVHPRHPLAHRASIQFEETLDFDHVGLPPSTAVHTMLQRAAARAGKVISYRSIVSNFDAAFRVVAADLGISVVPEEVGQTYVRSLDVRVIPLANAWARRSFVICLRDYDALQPAAQRIVDYLEQRARSRR